MKTSIRAKLGLLMLSISMILIVLVWIMVVILFKPMYYTMTQKELGHTMDKVAATIEQGGLTQSTLDQISDFINAGVCIEIADKDGNGVVLFEGIGDACQLHGAIDTSSDYYRHQRTIDSVQSKKVRQEVRAHQGSNYNVHLLDAFDNRQALNGCFYNNKYTVIVSTNISRTESIVSIVTAQLQTASIIAILIAVVCIAVSSNWFMKPIMKLSNATKEVAKGKYNVRLDFARDDEFGQLAKDFNFMTEEIKRSQDLQKELIASISHDLRTPLTIIRGYAESIKDITGNNEQVRNQQLTTIIDETDRLSNMVGSVLEYAKLNQGAYKMNIVQFNIADMCSYIADTYSHKAESEGKSIAYEGPQNVYVFADAQLMERVIHNFVSNALIHTCVGTKVIIAISILENGKARVSVRDSGQGIKQDDIKYIFDKYYRARKDEGRIGSGLGLSIVKAILENHNFDYGVNSKEGMGTEFWFEL